MISKLFTTNDLDWLMSSTKTTVVEDEHIFVYSLLRGLVKVPMRSFDKATGLTK